MENITYKVAVCHPVDDTEIIATTTNISEAIKEFNNYVTALEEGYDDQPAVTESHHCNYYAEWEDGEWVAVGIQAYPNN